VASVVRRDVCAGLDLLAAPELLGASKLRKVHYVPPIRHCVTPRDIDMELTHNNESTANCVMAITRKMKLR
jgi:hypothetical protein